MKNKPYSALLRPSNLSNEIEKWVPKSRETIPLKATLFWNIIILSILYVKMVNELSSGLSFFILFPILSEPRAENVSFCSFFWLQMIQRTKIISREVEFLKN
jgi:hypothetical protein